MVRRAGDSRTAGFSPPVAVSKTATLSCFHSACGAPQVLTPVKTLAPRANATEGCSIPWRNKQEVDKLKTDDGIAMVCVKCGTVWVTRVKQGTKGAQLLTEGGQPTELIGTHACAGCNSTLTVVGHAKGDITELKRSCKAVFPGESGLLGNGFLAQFGVVTINAKLGRLVLGRPSGQ